MTTGGRVFSENGTMTSEHARGLLSEFALLQPGWSGLKSGSLPPSERAIAKAHCVLTRLREIKHPVWYIAAMHYGGIVINTGDKSAKHFVIRINNVAPDTVRTVGLEITDLPDDLTEWIL